MEGLRYLESLAQWKGRGGFGLEKMLALMGELGNPQNSAKTIHVAGTNGKGSVSAAISSILGASGHQVLLNTSPHLVTVNERIVVDGEPIQDYLLNATVLKIKDAAERLGIEPSHFEAVTAAAFLLLADLKLPFGVIEVGLGGRLDATNVISKPEVCVIVTIDFDHESMLGDTTAKIAVEKAGIIKPNSPVVMGKLDESAQWVIRKICAERGSRLFTYGEDYFCESGTTSGSYIFRSKELGTVNFRPALQGEHQARNMAVAIAAARLTGVSCEAAAIGVEGLSWPARLERVQYKGIEMIVDSAHNPAGIESLISFLNTKNLKDLDVVFGAINTKRWKEMVDRLRPFVSNWHLLTPDFSEAVPSDDIADYLSSIDIKSVSYGHNYLKLLNNMEIRESKNSVLVAGSMYMVGKLKAEMGLPYPKLWRRM